MHVTRPALVRHGETDWNRQRRIQGTSDIPLNETGRGQAAVTGRALAAHARTGGAWHGIVASPLGRAMETAQIIATATRAKKPVTLCGEMASDARCTPLLIALGLTGFSMHPSALLEVRQAIAACDHARLRKLAPRLLRAQTKTGMERLLRDAQI